MLSSVPDEEQFVSGERSSYSTVDGGSQLDVRAWCCARGGDQTVGRRQGAM